MQPSTPRSLLPSNPVELIELIPPPDEIRIAISQRHAELTILRRLLKTAETRLRLCPQKREVTGASP